MGGMAGASLVGVAMAVLLHGPALNGGAPPASLQAQAPPTAHDAFAFVRALDAAAARTVWPGFNPAEWPIALFDGERTILLRHPSPPPEFTPMTGRPGVLVTPGRHAAVTGNSTREIGGRRTATVIATPGQDIESTMLACVEEVFHVFWLARNPSFRPNEMARYAYPVTDAGNLGPMLAEEEALARAIQAKADPEAAAWAVAAIRHRTERVARVTDEVRQYERALEMMEGTANYVARMAVGQAPDATATRLRRERPAEDIRWRFYDTGTALCLLLDRFDPGWQARIDGRADVTIGQALSAALTARGGQVASFSAAEDSAFRTRAEAAVADLVARRQRLRKELDERAGARLVIEVAVGAPPLRVERFDPLALMVLDAGEVAHARNITLAGTDGRVEVTNTAYVRGSFSGNVALTRPAGPHPLAGGIRQVTVVGIPTAPAIERDGDTVELAAPGVHLRFASAEVRKDGDTIRVVVRK